MILDQTHLFETEVDIPGLNEIHFEGENQDKMNVKELQDLLDKVEKLGAKENSITLNIPEGFLGFYERDWDKSLTIPKCIKSIFFPGSFIGINSNKRKFKFLPESKAYLMFPKGYYRITADTESSANVCGFGTLNCNEAEKLLREGKDCKLDNEIGSYSDLDFHSIADYGVEYIESNGTCFKINRVSSFDDDAEILETHSLEISKNFEISLDGFPVSLLKCIQHEKKNSFCTYFSGDTDTTKVYLDGKLCIRNYIHNAVYGIEYKSRNGFSISDLCIKGVEFFENGKSKKPTWGFLSLWLKQTGGNVIVYPLYEERNVLFNNEVFEETPESYEKLLTTVEKQNKKNLEIIRIREEEKRKQEEELQRQHEEELIKKQREEEEKKARKAFEAKAKNKPKESLKFATVNTKDMEVKFGSLMKYKGKGTEIALPDIIERIWAMALAENKNLKSVLIPDSVFDVGDSAFQGCTALENVNLPNNMKSIAEKTFYNCSSLKEITIPGSVIRISENAFSGCTSLTKENIHCEDWINKDDLLAGKPIEKI